MITENLRHTLAELEAMATIRPVQGSGSQKVRMGCPFHGSDHQRSELTVGRVHVLPSVFGFNHMSVRVDSEHVCTSRPVMSWSLNALSSGDASVTLQGTRMPYPTLSPGSRYNWRRLGFQRGCE